MKNFFKYLWGAKGKLLFLVFINAIVGLFFYDIFSNDTATGIRIGASLFFGAIEFLSIYQVWREYKGYEGFFGRK